MKTNTKTLAVSLSLLASANALAGMGGLNVQSNLGEPFSGSIVVTGKEAEALLQSRSVNVSGNGISGTVVPQGNGNAIIRLRSGGAVNEPVLNFVVKAGNQTRQYTAMINPARYTPKGETRRNNVVAAKPAYTANEYEAADIDEQAAKPAKKARKQRQRVAPMARSSNAQYHRVQTGETLAQIAARYRPHNMSQQRAMRAIMAANPRAFRRGTNGNIMYDGSTLYIPTGSQFQGYASSKKRHAQRRLSNRRYAAPAVAATAPAMAAETTAPQVQPQQTAPVTPPPVAQPATPQTPPPAAKAPSAPVASEPAKKVEPAKPAVASVPAQNAVASQPVSVPAATAPVAPSAPASAVAPVMASETAAASAASVPAVAASAASVAVASAPAKPKAKPRPKPVPQPEPEPETDWLPLVLGGAAGLALLGGAGYLLSRRRKAAQEDIADDDEFVVADDDEFVIEETAAVSPAVAAAQRVNLGTQSNFNDQDDNVFFEDTTVTSKPAADEFDLNNFEPEATFQAQPAVTTEADEDWDWLNDDNASIDATAQESNWDSGKAAASVATATAAGVAIASTQRDETPEFDAAEFDVAPAAPETSSDDDWLNEVFAADESALVVADEPVIEESNDLVFEDFNATPASVVETEPVVAESTDFDLDFDVSESDTVPATVAAVAPSQEDDLSFDVSLPENEVLTPTVEETDDLSFDLPAEPETNVSFDLDDIETPAPDSFDLPSEEPTDFNMDLPAEETAIADFDLDLSNEATAIDTIGTETADFDLNVADDTALSLDSDLSVANDDALNFAQESTVAVDDLAFTNDDVNAAELDSLNSLNDLDMLLDEPEVVAEPVTDLDGLSLDDAPVVTAAEPVVDDLSWMNEAPAEAAAAHNEANAAGFVSEAVGMAAPQEAKLELAKMYLEIDDAVAARETLRELIGESHGELQQQAKDLLADLGG